jgi:ABC-type nitrate/sulfonate/bicarbonate transport system ATPase subunit
MTPAVSFDSVTIRLPTPDGGALTVATDLSLDIVEGKFVAIVGPSGCGKSTLLNLAAGLLFAPEGKVRIFGNELHAINQHAAYLFQQDALLPWRTIVDNVLLGPLIRGRSRAEAEPEARHWLQRVGLAGFEKQFPHQLSGGMRKRAGLARAMALDPDILFFDEPSAGLDPVSSRMLDDLILALRDSLGATIVVVSHELASIFAIADNSIFIDAESKTLLEGGDPKKLVKESPHKQVRDFLTRGEEGRAVS